MTWVNDWKLQHVVPWTCKLCKRENEYLKRKCKYCGKNAPSEANKEIENEAATRIQRVFRSKRAKLVLKRKAVTIFEKRFDQYTGDIYYYNFTNGLKYETLPSYLCEDDFADGEEFLKAQKAYNEEKEFKQQLKQAKHDRDEARRIETEKREIREEKERKEKVEAFWGPIIREASVQGELNACWKGITEIHEDVLNFGPKLVMLRFVGNPLVRVPDNFVVNIPNLVVLSLSTCNLEELPDCVCNLIHLKELNLIKNNLQYLPENLGNLKKLEELYVSSNKLKSLPKSISELKLINKLDLEQNNLKILPPEIVGMEATIVSWSNTRLRALPSNLGSFITLVSLTANHNRIKRIPSSIGQLRNLRHLSLCDNQIMLIPDTICNCTLLERLWLDWNKVTELPGDFLNLTNLVSLHLEGNPMRIPEMEYIVQGVQKVREWFQEEAEFIQGRERQLVIVSIQNILHDCVDLGIVEASVLRNNVEYEFIGDGIEDRYYAIVPVAFNDIVIPAWTNYFQQEHGEHRIFPYTDDEVDDAMENAVDAYGKMCCTDVETMFVKCSCTRNGIRRVCIPPEEGFMCKRKAMLIKHRVVKSSERESRESLKREANEVLKARDNARDCATMYSNSIEGKQRFVMEAQAKARKELIRRKKEKIIEVKLKKLIAKKEKKDAERKHAKEKLETQREKHIQVLKRRENQLLLKLEGYLAAWDKDIAQGELIDIDDERKNLPENVELDFIEQEQKSANDKFKYDRKVLKSGVNIKVKIRGFGIQFARKVKRLRNIYIHEIINDFVIQQMDEEETRVKHEYGIMRRIMKNWRMLNVKMTFDQWHNFATVQKRWRVHFEKAEQEALELQRQSDMVEQEHLKAERAKWIEKVDPFTDDIYIGNIAKPWKCLQKNQMLNIMFIVHQTSVDALNQEQSMFCPMYCSVRNLIAVMDPFTGDVYEGHRETLEVSTKEPDVELYQFFT